MEGLAAVLEAIRDHKLASGHLRGVFHIAIGRKITNTEGQVLSAGVTWRELSVLLKELKYDKDLVTEIGGDPETLSPRDRQRMWYSAIALAHPDSHEAHAEANVLIGKLKTLGFLVGASPFGPSKKPAPKPAAAPSPAKKKKKA